MKNFVIYDATGRILRTGTCMDGDFEKQVIFEEEQVAEGVGHWDTHYVEEGVLKLRPDNPSQLEITPAGFTLTEVPIPSHIYVGDQEYYCNDGVAEVELPHPGYYRIRVEPAFPIKPLFAGVSRDEN